ncbi:hypothetical protein M441DRAFT_43848 [Trichoderma asperellum CBS 433.97]|uniref:Uncharacterized protein n=1 Tax=Trichoderma asperellum (strain ATCC 204424 / CBS 433.97 / NBRC 101777) TaxID=1042311 RepID=A0A2T3ZM30_TRIA4|nr:hypothetical protein M441DRAFT_43848 [Trichoderma asperellum CBS 433.97]PTB45867.1 hypothetical protein M441DRAFT_43848 [Trichoderma asperellum CBS 433.97]
MSTAMHGDANPDWLDENRFKTLYIQKTRYMYKVRCKTDRIPRDCWRVSLPASGRRSVGDSDWSIRCDRIAETFTTREMGCCVTLRMQPDDLTLKIFFISIRNNMLPQDQQVIPTQERASCCTQQVLAQKGQIAQCPKCKLLDPKAVLAYEAHTAQACTEDGGTHLA